MAAAVAKSTGCKNSYFLMKLPNHNRVLQTFPDAMHTVKDSIERVFFLLVGKSKLDKIATLEKKLKDLDSMSKLGRENEAIKPQLHNILTCYLQMS